MKTTGQLLQETRASKHLELADVAKITKIRPQFLLWLEADDYGRLPSSTVAKGFIKNYAQYLGLNPEHLLALFRRDFVENQAGQIVPRGMVEPVNQPSFWTPRTTIIALVAFIFTLFGAYMFYQYQILVGPPSLEISAPANNITVAEPTVEIIGMTDPEATISVNHNLVALDKGGRFSLRVPLESGANQINIIATGKSGKTTSLSRVVNLK